jgi:uncharacterized cupredoxin-like copper-binding protein
VAATDCSSATSAGPDGGCATDQNGTNGGTEVVYLTVSDTAFAVGGVDSGSTQSNITIENGSTVTLTLTNVGTRPHDFVVQCQPTPNSNGCPMQSCFPPEANIPALAPGKSATTKFVAPFKEGAYQFVSDLPGDTQTSPDAGTTGLVGEFLLM